MLLGKKVPDLIGGVETNWFDSPYSDDFQVLPPRHPGHQFRNACGDAIDHLMITRRLSEDEYSCRKSSPLQCRSAFEEGVVEGVVRSEGLYDDDVAWTNRLHTHKALPYRRDPEPACQRPYEYDENEHPKAELPRRLD